MPRYFTGRSVSSPRLTLAEATTFKDLVQHLIDMPVPLSITAASYHAMTKQEKAKAKLVSYITACTFPDSPWDGGRLLEHAQECNLLMLDIDELPDGNCPAAPFTRQPSLISEKLDGFNFAAYKTISSTPEKPRLRIMLDARAIPVEDYPNAVLTIAQHLGLSHLTRESAVAVQPMFRPTMFADQDPDLDHPLIASSMTGRPFEVKDIAEDLDSLPGMVSGSRPARVRSSGDSVEDFLTFYQQPIPEITLTVANEALASINPDLSRPEWVEIAAALKHQFGVEHEAEAFSIFDTWSSNGTKYAGEKDTATNWKSLREQPKGRAPITIRTLLKRALDGGWDGGRIKEECFQSVAKWLSFECKSITQLMADGVKRIAATPMISVTEEDALLQMIVAVGKQKFETKMAVGALRKDLKKQKDSLHHSKTPDEVEKPAWAKGIAYVASTNEIFRQSNRQVFSIEAWDKTYSRFLLPTEEQLEKADLPVNQTTLNKPLWLPSDYALNHIKCQTVDDYDYDPSSPEEIVVKREGKRYVNTYRKSSYRAADKDHAEHAEEVFFNHLINLIAEPHYRRCLVDWMAHNVQYPGLKIRWAILLQGAEGCGKTFIAECMRAVLGGENVKLINMETIKRGWTEWAFGSQIVAIEEIRVAGANRHEVMNRLKEPISNDVIPINERNKNTRSFKNVTNYLMFSNHHDALAINDESRRYFVLKSPLQKKEQVADLMRDPEYFTRLFEMLTLSSSGLRYMLENWRISDDFKSNGPAPVTKYLHEMIADTSNELNSVLQRILEDGDNPLIQPDVIASTSFMNALEMEDGMRHVTPQYMASVLRDAGFTRLDGRHIIANERQWVWVRQDKIKDNNPLELLRARINGALHKQEDDWLT